MGLENASNLLGVVPSILLAFFAFILFVLIVFMPFFVYGTNSRTKETSLKLDSTNKILREIRDSLND